LKRQAERRKNSLLEEIAVYAMHTAGNQERVAD
jgi:hypothetical protein